MNDRLKSLYESVTGQIFNEESFLAQNQIDPDWREHMPIQPIKTKHSSARGGEGLLPFKGTWTEETAKHLLNRTQFGYNKEDLDTAVQQGLKNTLDRLMKVHAFTEEPVIYKEGGETAQGEKWLSKASTFGEEEFNRMMSLRVWWLLNIQENIGSLQHKMALFLHNHFVVQSEVSEVANPYYEYHQLLYQYSLGNYKTLCEKITIDKAMLIYLNGNQNTKQSPNENFARELFELFTVGKGPLKGEGDYTFYTEQDVKEAARVLTGYTLTWPNVGRVFVDELHDNTEKQFSSAFNNEKIIGQGELEYKALINMIFKQDQTAKFFVRKFLRFFMHYEITEEIEQEVVLPLADYFIHVEFDLGKLVTNFFSSEWFYNTNNRATHIKSPIEFVFSILKVLDFKMPSFTPVVSKYEAFDGVFWLMALMNQMVSNPPVVAGWPAYYQLPSYQRLWINASTLPFRRNIIFLFVFGNTKDLGLSFERDFLNMYDFIQRFENPSDVNQLIDDLSNILLSIPPNENLKNVFKNYLIKGLPDFEWTVEYNKVKNNPTQEGINQIDFKLKAMVFHMMSLAEFTLN